MGHRRARDERCGSKATNDLDAFVDRRPVSCVPFSLDQYGRTVASCAVGDADLGEWLVRNGLDLPRLGLPPSAFSFTAPSIRRGMSENRSRHLSSRGAAGAPSARAGPVRRVMIPKKRTVVSVRFIIPLQSLTRRSQLRPRCQKKLARVQDLQRLTG